MHSELLNVVKEYALMRLEEERDYVKEKKCFPPLLNYRREHVETVVGLAETVAREVKCNEEICLVSAWLHDLGKCYNPRMTEDENLQRRKNHHKAGAEEAEEFLKILDVEHCFIQEVTLGIEKHVGLTRPEKEPIEPLTAAVLWDADKLSKIGITGWLHHIAYTIAYTQETHSYDDIILDNGLDTMEMIAKHLNTRVAEKLAENRLERYKSDLRYMRGALQGAF